ncbi:endonuclease/exonuclease/phosphatase family protein [Streptobacillus moniliformis]|uniref:endonuclease/exonuclease/phosphatase family protein n=1 Tax=Streptobacillus moniliformis TaxID=34105 RepID=UPI0007E4C09F|nr:endonuclease/exonuclease/phosphatase family protein [Streptobacillus moniliformis]
MKRKFLFLSLFVALSGISISETISQIQGNEMLSKFQDKDVTKVRGIVTAIRKTKYNNGFFMQSVKHDKDIRTSEGIYVENINNANVKVGDLVTVDGKVKEIYLNKPDKTQPPITSIQANSIKVMKSKQKVRPLEHTGKNIPIKVRDNNNPVLNVKTNAMDYYEALEGVLIRIKNPIVTGANQKYGDITVVPSKGMYAGLRSINGGVVYNNYETEQTQRITVNITPWNIFENGKYKDNVTPNPGDEFKGDIEGIVFYEHGEYRLYPTSPFPGIIDKNTKPEKNKYTYNDELLNVVSYNIENFSHVDTPERVDELANQVATILQNPDILGLIEVGDDDGQKESEIVSSNENMEALVKAIKEKTGIDYGFVSVDPMDGKDGGWPAMHIRNVILYRIDKLNVVGFNQGDAITDTEVIKDGDNVRLTYNPGRIGNQDKIWEEVRKPLVAQFEYSGKNIFVIANHLKSKRSDDKVYGVNHPVIRKSEDVRIPEGKYINNFVKDILSKDDKATVIVLGDMNDFEFSKTTKNINGDELVDVISLLPKNERYTYVYQGASQTLDNIMINKKYKDNVNIDVIRVNSEFLKEQGSFSDHDPIFIQFKVD